MKNRVVNNRLVTETMKKPVFSGIEKHYVIMLNKAALQA